MLTTMYGLLAWACLSGAFFVWLLTRVAKNNAGMVSLIFAFFFALALIPFWRGTSLAELLYGLFDLPSTLFTTLVVATLIYPANMGLKALWHLAGITSLVTVAYYLAGDPSLFEFGYGRQSLVIILGFFLISVFTGSLSAMIVVLISTLAAALNVMDTHNSWLDVTGSAFAVVWSVKLTIDLLYRLITRGQRKRQIFSDL